MIVSGEQLDVLVDTWVDTSDSVDLFIVDFDAIPVFVIVFQMLLDNNLSTVKTNKP